MVEGEGDYNLNMPLNCWLMSTVWHVVQLRLAAILADAGVWVRVLDLIGQELPLGARVHELLM